MTFAWFFDFSVHQPFNKIKWQGHKSLNRVYQKEAVMTCTHHSTPE